MLIRCVMWYDQTHVTLYSISNRRYTLDIKFLQKYKKQHLDKLKEEKTPWVLDGTSSSYHLMIAYHTKSYKVAICE